MSDFRRNITCLFALAAVVLVGCSQRMDDQPKLEPYEQSSFFSNGLGMREPIEGTIARGGLRLDTHFFEGRVDGKLAPTLPEQVELNEALLERGRERYDAFCSACHGRAGYGDGMVVARGFPAPPSYHSNRLQKVPVGHVYDVITNGLGRMPRLSDRIPPADRWAIVAYTRALQLSQNVQATPELRKKIEEQLAAEEKAAEHSHEEGEHHE